MGSQRDNGVSVFNTCQEFYKYCKEYIENTTGGGIRVSGKDEIAASLVIETGMGRNEGSVMGKASNYDWFTLPDIFKYRREIANLYIIGSSVKNLNGNPCISIDKYPGLSDIFSEDKVLPLESDSSVVVTKCTRRIHEALRRISKISIPNCAMGCMYMGEDDVLKIRVEDGYGSYAEYVYGDNDKVGYEVSKYTEILLSSLVKLVPDIKVVYWIANSGLRNYAIRDSGDGNEKVITFF